MKIIAVIPSRYSSSRFPGKPLAQIAGKSMIRRVYERVSLARGIDGVYVATDDGRIRDEVLGFGGDVLMTSERCATGTDRIAECAAALHLDDDDIVLNVQGDQPLVHPEMIADLISCFDDPSVVMGTLKREIADEAELLSSNAVKVVTDVRGDALYFSRSPIPCRRSDSPAVKSYRHIGLYGYRKSFLMEFSRLPRTPLETCESLEQLRALESGYRIRVKETKHRTMGVDTPEQLKQVEKLIYELER